MVATPVLAGSDPAHRSWASDGRPPEAEDGRCHRPGGRDRRPVLRLVLVGVHSYAQVLILGVFLGVAGASFAVALPLASRWYPPEHQGTALGIAGAGNSGTALAALIAPSLAIAFGWTNVFGLALIPLIVVFVFYLLVAKDAPGMPATEVAGRIPESAPGQRRVVVHVLLLGDLRRLRRPGLVADHLLQHPVRAGREDRRLLHRRLRLRRLAGATRSAATSPTASAASRACR
jgi:MFS family permease